MSQTATTSSSRSSSKLAVSVAAGLASGLLTLVDPAQLRPRTRLALLASSGAAYGTLSWIGTSGTDGLKPTAAVRGSVALGLGALGVVGTHYGFVLDRKIHQGLQRRGVRNPRPLMAVVSGIFTTAMMLLEPSAREAEIGAEASEHVLPERELPASVRELVAILLASTEDFGAPLLREQLKSAREQYWGDPDEFTNELTFVVPEASVRTVPRNYTFPVHADFTTTEGNPMRVSLRIANGVLDGLIIDVLHEELDPATTHDADPFEALTRWPLASEVTIGAEH